MTTKVFRIMYTGISRDFKVHWTKEPYPFTLHFGAPIVVQPDGTQELTLNGAKEMDSIPPEHHKEFEAALVKIGIIPSGEYKDYRGYKIGYYSTYIREDAKAPEEPVKDTEQLATALDQQNKDNVKPENSNIARVSGDGTASVLTEGNKQAITTVLKDKEEPSSALKQAQQQLTTFIKK